MKFKTLIIGVLASLTMAGVMVAPASATSGFDQYGYNNTARIFNGTLGSWCAEQNISTADCATYYGNPADKLVMKWNAAWDTCNAAGGTDVGACKGAWTDNEFNGMKGGSGSVWHYKIVWNAICATKDPLSFLPDGGYCLWGPYEVLMDQGTFDGVHSFLAKSTPNGYGVKP
jgi:hypothetical protein